jgi:hypothetical protein
MDTLIRYKEYSLLRKLRLNLRKDQVKCYIWTMVLYSGANWTLRKVDQNYVESFEMWCRKRMEKITWMDCVRNEKY